MMTSIIIGQSQRDKETREPDDAISITSGSEEGREKRPAMDLARGLSSAQWADEGALWQAFIASGRRPGSRAAPRPPRAPWRRDDHHGPKRGDGRGSSGYQHQKGE